MRRMYERIRMEGNSRVYKKIDNSDKNRTNIPKNDKKNSINNIKPNIIAEEQPKEYKRKSYFNQNRIHTRNNLQNRNEFDKLNTILEPNKDMIKRRTRNEFSFFEKINNKSKMINSIKNSDINSQYNVISNNSYISESNHSLLSNNEYKLRKNYNKNNHIFYESNSKKSFSDNKREDNTGNGIKYFAEKMFENQEKFFVSMKKENNTLINKINKENATLIQNMFNTIRSENATFINEMRKENRTLINDIRRENFFFLGKIIDANNALLKEFFKYQKEENNRVISNTVNKILLGDGNKINNDK